MIKWAIIFAIISVIAAIFGLTGIAAGSAAIAKFLFGAGSVRTTRACMPDEVKMTITRSWLIDGPPPVVLSEFARTLVCDRFAHGTQPSGMAASPPSRLGTARTHRRGPARCPVISIKARA